jgi:branched-chain amino acid transport system substrate-binding protein
MVRLTRITTRRGKRAVVFAACLGLIAAASACSSSSSSSTTAQATGGASTSASASASPAQSASVSDFAAYTGGSGKANASLSPVTIGFINQQGGPPGQDFPQSTAAANATVKLINTELGGVHGHPVQLATCFIKQSEAEGTTCGQQFLNDKNVLAIADGIETTGNASMYRVIGGAIPVLIGVSANPADDSAKNVFELDGSQTSAFAAYGTFLRQKYPDAKTAAIAYSNQPGSVPAADAQRSTLQKNGFTVQMIPYSPTATDLIGPATQMEQADIAVPSCGFVDCPVMAKAIKQIGGSKPAISSPLWTFLPPPSYPGGDLPNWIVGEATANLADPSDAGVAAYFAKTAQYGLKHADALSPFAGVAFGNLLLAVKVMNTIPFAQLTRDSLTAKLHAYTGAVPLGPPSVDCTGTLVPSAPASCSQQAQFYQYGGKGQWNLLAPWMKPAA